MNKASTRRFRQLAAFARLEAEDRRRELPRDVAMGGITMAEADAAIEAMEEIADILDWVADRKIEIELIDDGEPGW